MKSHFVYPPMLIICTVTWQSVHHRGASQARQVTDVNTGGIFPDEDRSDESVMTPRGDILAAAKQQRFPLSDEIGHHPFGY